jgi:putative transposase
MAIRSWKFRIYPSKQQENLLHDRLVTCKDLWNYLLEHSKKYYEKTQTFPSRRQLYLLTKGTPLFSQVAQNVADRLVKSMRGMIAGRRVGVNTGFPRFKSIDRMKSLTYPQLGFGLGGKLKLSGIGSISIKKHREIQGTVKTLTVKKSNSGKWFAVFTSEVKNGEILGKQGAAVGLDLGIENFAYLSDGETVENPRHLKKAEQKIIEHQWRLSRKKKGSQNRVKARLKIATAYEKLTNRRRDFLHKASRKMVVEYSFIAMEYLNSRQMAKGFLAKSVLDCGWAEFSGMLRYKAEEAGCEVVFVEPAYTSQTCSNCGSVRKKSLAERWHECACGASMHRDLNAAINILKRATAGHAGSQASGEETSTQKWASILNEGGSLAI